MGKRTTFAKEILGNSHPLELGSREGICWNFLDVSLSPGNLILKRQEQVQSHRLSSYFKGFSKARVTTNLERFQKFGNSHVIYFDGVAAKTKGNRLGL